MSKLYMINLPVRLRELRYHAAVNGLQGDEGRALHHFLSETFGKSVLRPFRMMPGRNGASMASLYAYSAFDEDTLRQSIDTAPPEMMKILDTDHLAVKEMPQTWHEGRRLAFDVRVRPIRRLLKPLAGWCRSGTGKSPQVFKKGAEVDAFLVATLRQFPDGQPPMDQRLDRETVYREWLAERLSLAAKLMTAHMKSVERSDAMRRSKTTMTENTSQGSDVIFHGELSIIDPVAFGSLLASGIGRHTAYGYGMLLLRPARG